MTRIVPALALVLAAGAASAAAAQSDATNGLSGLPTPRFVSIASGEANMRAGPGETYPVTWTYRRRGLPVEVVKEWGIWRQVRDPDGVTGWMNKNLLTGKRTAMIVGKVATLYWKADAASTPVWRAEPGVVGTVQVCDAGWCRISIDGRNGYVPVSDIFGVYKGELIE
jgi:SH3-like domain-containing protein